MLFKNLHRKKYIVSNKESTSYQTITCGVPQDWMLGPLLFLTYVNDLHGASACISLTMLADDTNLSCSGKDTKHYLKQWILNLVGFLNDWKQTKYL